MAITDAANASEIQDAVERAVEELGVVGAAAAVVHRGEEVFIGGFGVREQAGLAVDADTLFAIGSATKSFTTLAIAQLAEKGVLDWDTPIQHYLPDFALHDPFASAQATPRDLATHRVGLPRHEFSWYKADLSRPELVRRLRYLEPSRPFRTTFQYQNAMYMTRGHLVEWMPHQTWEEYVRGQILVPLGMVRTNFSVGGSQADANHAKPYAVKDGAPQPVPFANIDALAPAGAINSSARELARWLQLHLGRAEGEGAAIASRSAVAALHAPHIVIPDAGAGPLVVAPAYGLGWFTEVFRGHAVVHHGGNIDGFTALVLLMPDQELGIAMLCNQELSVLPAAAAYAIVDRVLGVSDRDWTSHLHQKQRQLLGMLHQGGDYRAERVEGTTPSRPLAAFAGRYEHPAYGSVRILEAAGALQLAYHPWPDPLALEHFHYDVFTAHGDIGGTPTSWRIPFRTGLDGAIESLDVQFEALTAPIVFRRQPDPAEIAQSDLNGYVGRYLVAGAQHVSIDRHGEGLVATVEGQPPMALEPSAPRRFTLKGFPGFSVQFEPPRTADAPAGFSCSPTAHFRLPARRTTEASERWWAFPAPAAPSSPGEPPPDGLRATPPTWQGASPTAANLLTSRATWLLPSRSDQACRWS